MYGRGISLVVPKAVFIQSWGTLSKYALAVCSRMSGRCVLPFLAAVSTECRKRHFEKAASAALVKGEKVSKSPCYQPTGYPKIPDGQAIEFCLSSKIAFHSVHSMAHDACCCAIWHLKERKFLNALDAICCRMCGGYLGNVLLTLDFSIYADVL
eukprot:1398905-Amphidinium_carterae.1